MSLFVIHSFDKDEKDAVITVNGTKELANKVRAVLRNEGVLKGGGTLEEVPELPFLQTRKTGDL